MVTEMVPYGGGCLGEENSQEGVRSQDSPQSLGAGEEMASRQEEAWGGGLSREGSGAWSFSVPGGGSASQPCLIPFVALLSPPLKMMPWGFPWWSSG